MLLSHYACLLYRPVKAITFNLFLRCQFSSFCSFRYLGVFCVDVSAYSINFMEHPLQKGLNNLHEYQFIHFPIRKKEKSNLNNEIMNWTWNVLKVQIFLYVYTLRYWYFCTVFHFIFVSVFNQTTQWRQQINKLNAISTDIHFIKSTKKYKSPAILKRFLATNIHWWRKKLLIWWN